MPLKYDFADIAMHVRSNTGMFIVQVYPSQVIKYVISVDLRIMRHAIVYKQT